MLHTRLHHSAEAFGTVAYLNITDFGYALCSHLFGIKCSLVTETFWINGLSWNTRLFNGPLSGTTQVSQQYKKSKTNMDLLEQETVSVSGISLASTPPLSFLKTRCLFVAQPTVSKHWRQTCLGNVINFVWVTDGNPEGYWLIDECRCQWISCIQVLAQDLIFKNIHKLNFFIKPTDQLLHLSMHILCGEGIIVLINRLCSLVFFLSCIQFILNVGFISVMCVFVYVCPSGRLYYFIFIYVWQYTV